MRKAIMKLYLLLSLLFVLSVSAYAQTSPSSDAAPNAAIDARVKSAVAEFKGKVSLYAKNLETGASYSLNGDEQVRTASTIKLAIMVEAFARVAEGKAKWTDELLLTEEKKVTGSGILFEFGGGLKLTLRDAVHLMIVVSDNTATNLILDHLTADAVNARMDTLGLKKTRALRKIGGGGVSKAGEDPENRRFGLGVTTPREIATLIERIERGEIVNAEASKEMIAILKRQQDHNGIGRNLKGIKLASKAGALDALRSDVAILYTPGGRIAMAITCDGMPEPFWSPDNPGLLMLSRLSEILVDALKSK
jgi:beta-lactamase class A